MNTTNQEIPQSVICKQSTDRKPLIVNGFTGGYNNCLRYLHHSVKPIVGVVKYDFSDWKLFPTKPEQAKELAFKWSSSIEKKKNFIGKSVVIFFHLISKTIRVEVKHKAGYVLETPEMAVGYSNEEVNKEINRLAEEKSIE
jgi:large-conductance mechanosensitive channel